MTATQAGDDKKAMDVVFKNQQATDKSRSNVSHFFALVSKQRQQKKKAFVRLQQALEEATKIKEWYYRDAALGTMICIASSSG